MPVTRRPASPASRQVLEINLQPQTGVSNNVIITTRDIPGIADSPHFYNHSAEIMATKVELIRSLVIFKTREKHEADCNCVDV
jgi:hypothetical protein